MLDQKVKIIPYEKIAQGNISNRIASKIQGTGKISSYTSNQSIFQLLVIGI